MKITVNRKNPDENSKEVQSSGLMKWIGELHAARWPHICDTWFRPTILKDVPQVRPGVLRIFVRYIIADTI
jgi:hypothetical protein